LTCGVAGLGDGATAVQFDGLGSGRMIVPDHDTLNPDHLTIEARISWSGPNGGQQRIVEKSFGPSINWRTAYSLSILDDGRVHAEVTTDTGDFRADSAATVAQGVASHVAMTYDGSTVALYINGVLDGSTPATGTLANTSGSSQLGIGNQVERARPFKGVIDEVALFGLALPVERIRAHLALPSFVERELATHLSLIASVQHERHVSYTETHFTNDAIGAAPVAHHRLRQPCEVQTYELTGIVPQAGAFYFDVAHLRQWDLSLRYRALLPASPKPVARRHYHALPTDPPAAMRLVDHRRTLFFNDDPDNTTDFLNQALALGTQGKLGLPYEHYKLALTDSLLDAVFTDGRLDLTASGSSPRQSLRTQTASGYLSGAAAVARFGASAAGTYWQQSGIAGFAPDAAQHFYLPEKYTDSFNNDTLLDFDENYDLFIASSTDALGNLTRITRFDYRVLAPRELQDINGNLTQAYFDVLGMVAAIAMKGKGAEGDKLDGLTDALANPPVAERVAFFSGADYDEAQARTWLGNATMRHVYWFGETPGANGQPVWGQHHARACAIVREKHVAQLDAASGEPSRLQVAFECSDGQGVVLMKKVLAEPAPGSTALRWIASGKTILNNKGKPVKQYAPYFSQHGHRCNEPVEEAVTPLMYYDAVGRLMRTEMPDGTFSRVVFSA
ncbi:MAG: LamG domain-containing protein, partial [Telluria sp.]